MMMMMMTMMMMMMMMMMTWSLVCETTGPPLIVSPLAISNTSSRSYSNDWDDGICTDVGNGEDDKDEDDNDDYYDDDDI